MTARPAKIVLLAAAARGEWDPPAARIPLTFEEQLAIERWNANRGRRRDKPEWLMTLGEADM